MRSFIKKFALAISLLLFSGTLYAMSNCCETSTSTEPKQECQEENVYPALGDIPCAYNCPARVDVNGCWDMYLTASFIYWYATEQNLDLGTEIIASDPANIVYKNHKPDFEYKPGFKVGLGSYFDHDNWGFYVEYTRYYIENKNNVSQSAPATAANTNWAPFLPQGITSPFAVFFNWDLDMDIIDFELSRPYYLGKMLTVVPHVGLRLDFIDQEYRFGVTTPLTAGGKARSDSWAIGPRFGMDTAWDFGSGFRLLGNVAASLAYSSFDVKLSESAAGVSNNLKSEDNFLTPNAEYALGFAWGRYFSDHGYYFDLAALYEFHVFWDANMMNYEVCKAGNMYSKSGAIGNLYLHGLTITARLDF